MSRSSLRQTVQWLFAALILWVLAAPGAFAQSAGCQVTYANSWVGGDGFGANIEIRNTGPAITNGWTLIFSFPGNQRIQNGWPVSFSQPAGSAQVTVASNAAWNQSISSGGSITVGFNGTFSGANDPPTSFMLNGVACNGGGTTQHAADRELCPARPADNHSQRTPPCSLPRARAIQVALSAASSSASTAIWSIRTPAHLTASTSTGLAAGSHTAQATAFDNGTPALSTATAAVPFTVQGVVQQSIIAAPTTLTLAGGASGTSTSG